MRYQKGQSGNLNGRPKGSRNKASEGLRMLITEFLEQRFDQIIEDFEELDAKDRLKFYVDLIQYAVPKLQAVSNDIDFEKLDNNTLDEIVNRLMNNHEATFTSHQTE